jgi:hypothetical protein
MVTQEGASYAINITLHVFILFTFLTVFFFAFVSKLAKKNINDALAGIIDDNSGNLLDEIDKWDKKIKPKTYPNINWNKADKLAKEIVANSQGELPEITKNNTRLKWVGLAMVASMFLLLVGMVFYYRFVLKLDVQLGRIFAENAVIFLFVGAIEAFFFINIASKYVPVTPDFVTTTILDRIKYRVSHAVLDQ